MNKVVVLLILVVALALAKAVIVGLVIALLLVLIYSFITRPAETLGFLGALMLFGLANARPLAFIIAAASLAVAFVVVGAKSGAGPK